MGLGILFISARSDIGGGPKALFDQARKIREISPNARLYFAAPAVGHYAALYRNLGDDFFELPFRSFSPRSLLGLLQFTRKNRIQIIHSHGRGAGIYSRILGLFGFSVIHTFHGVHKPKNLSDFVKLLVDILLARNTDFFITVSRQEEELAQHYHLLGGKPCEWITNGINFDEFRASSTTGKHNAIPENDKHIILGSLSRLDYQKGNDILIRHFESLHKQHPQFHLYIAGAGKEMPKLIALVQHLGMNESVRLIGEITDAALFLNSIDIYVSASRGEGLPISILEALAMGKRCVISDVSGHRDLGEYCTLFHLDDADDFVHKIVGIDNQPSPSTDTLIHRFDINKIASRIFLIYQEMATSGKT